MSKNLKLYSDFLHLKDLPNSYALTFENDKINNIQFNILKKSGVKINQ